MKFSRLILCVGVGLVATTILTPAFAGVTVGRTLLYFEPVSPQFAPLSAPEEDGQVLYQPHDGSFESAFTMPTQEDVEFVQFWAFPSTEGTLLAFEACFYSLATVPNFQYEFVYYSVSAGGEEAEPGTFREDRESPVFDILSNTVTCQPIIFEAQGDPGVEVRELLTYLGAKWNGEDFPSVHLLVDTNGPDSTNGWGRVTDFGSDWLPLRLTEPFTAYRNLAIRFVWLGPTITDDTIFEDGFESGDTSAWSVTEGLKQDVGVFVSSASFPGDFGGLGSADATCQSLGTAAIPGSGPWVAWLSDSATDAVDRIPQPAGSGAYVRASFPGVVIADDLADLTDGSLDEIVGDLDENGSAVAGDPWTGTDDDGTVGAETCLDWTSSDNSDSGVTGDRLSTDSSWTNQAVTACTQPRHFYCFGVLR